MTPEAMIAVRAVVADSVAADSVAAYAATDCQVRLA